MSSLTKPLKGGNAEMETAPIRNSSAVVGILLINPPISSMFLVSVAFTMLPDVRKSRLLKMAWFNVWNSAPANARKPIAWRPDMVKITYKPNPMSMIPTFSMLWKAINVLCHVLFRA